MGADDPAKKGVCSNYLCDADPGLELKLTGPAGKVMLMPEEKPETDIIMIATGTGIAPYRAFIRRLFTEQTPAREAFKGQAWLFLGVANTDSLLYDDEWQKVLKDNPENFRLDYALSREQNNKSGGKMYIQDKVGRFSVMCAVFSLCAPSILIPSYFAGGNAWSLACFRVRLIPVVSCKRELVGTPARALNVISM